MARVALEAGVSPGLIHHHFDHKQDLLDALLNHLIAEFRRGEAAQTSSDPLTAYLDQALSLGPGAHPVAARCWVGVLSEALRDPALFRRVRSFVDTEIVGIERRAEGELDGHGASAILAYVMGALVMGAFAPRKTRGFAASGAASLRAGLRGRG